MKNRFLIGAVLLFIFLMIPYFQNIQMNPPVIFFFMNKGFVGLYLPILFLWMIEWALILLAVQNFINNTKQKAPKKFDLN